MKADIIIGFNILKEQFEIKPQQGGVIVECDCDWF